MSDTFKLHGDISVGAGSCGSSSGSPTVVMQIEETVSLKGVPMISEYELTADPAVAVAFGGLASASVVVIKSVGGKVRVRLTSADGSAQSIPVDSLAIILSDTVPFSAIDLTRVTGTLTTVKVTLGEKA